jgi:hypothetical protein
LASSAERITSSVVALIDERGMVIFALQRRCQASRAR